MLAFPAGNAPVADIRAMWNAALMPNVLHFWGVSNPGPDKLHIWLEPWAEEFEIPTRSTVILKAPDAALEEAPGDAEWTPNHLVFWANVSTIEVFIDDEFQNSCSASIPAPEGLTKAVLGIAFSNYAPARLGGRDFDLIEQKPWWQRLRFRLGL